MAGHLLLSRTSAGQLNATPDNKTDANHNESSRTFCTFQYKFTTGTAYNEENADNDIPHGIYLFVLFCEKNGCTCTQQFHILRFLQRIASFYKRENDKTCCFFHESRRKYGIKAPILHLFGCLTLRSAYNSDKWRFDTWFMPHARDF